jgi:hypothetical protein
MNRVALIVLLIALLVPASATAQRASEHQEVNSAWMYIEVGNFNKAEETLKAAYKDTPWGKSNAELLFALSAIFWERRNAMGSYQWLAEAVATRTERPYDWQPGDGWDARIDKRKQFLERNFSIVKLRLSDGRSVPPLQDPPSKDPVVKAFANGIAARVADADKVDTTVLYLVIPKGTYWVGDEQMTLLPGVLELAKAPVWKLRGDAWAWANHKKRAAGEDVTTASGGTPLGSGVRVAVGVGAGLGTRLVDDGADALGAGPRVGVEAGYDVAFEETPAAMRIGGQFDTTPVPACGTHQASAMIGGMHVGPRLAVSLTEGAWLTGTFGVRLGGGRAVVDDAARIGCAEGDDGDGAFAVQISGEGGSGTVALSELGWRGALFSAGPFAEIGIMASPSGSGPRFGFGVQFGYDRLVPILPASREVRFRTDDGIGKASVGTFGGNASFGRVTIGIRGVVLLP